MYWVIRISSFSVMPRQGRSVGKLVEGMDDGNDDCVFIEHARIPNPSRVLIPPDAVEYVHDLMWVLKHSMS